MILPAARPEKSYGDRMAKILRRHFLQQAGATAALFAAPQAPGFDVLITGGRVIDPARKIDAVLDVGIAGSRIAALGASLPRENARQVFDAGRKIVTPGLIDMHGHVFDQFLPTSIDPDLVGIPKGVTTIVDAGSSGANTFPGFRKYIIERAATRIYALLNISTIGLVVQNEIYLDPKMIDVNAAVKTIQENRAMILGIKVRITGRDQDVPHDIDVLKKAREAADQAAVPIMLHWTNDPALLAILKAGDILVHPFNPPRSGPSLLGADGKILPQILELKQRGIFTDFAHGNHLQWETAEKAAERGWFPDTISTDIHRAHAAPNGAVIDLPTTMSKFLHLGLTVNQAIEKVTANPVRILKFPEKIGNLEPSAVADVTVIEIQNGSFDLLDSTRQKRTARQRIVPVATVRAGKLTLAVA